MGTQFSSRLTQKQRSQVMSRSVVIARRYVRESGAGALAHLRPPVRRRVVDEIIGELLGVAQGHHFFELFEKSEVFVEVLDWLKDLESDAAANGFSASIRRYGLDEHAMPQPVLARHLHAIVTRPEHMTDPFRVAVSTAAKTVLSAAASGRVESGPQDSEAVVFGKRLAKLGMKKLVRRFVGQFISEFLRSLLGKADQARTSAMNRELRVVIGDEAADRIARKAGARIQQEGGWGDATEVRRVVREVLETYVADQSTPSAA